VGWMLKLIYGPETEKRIGGWRKLHKEKFHILYAPNTVYWVERIKEKNMESACSTIWRNEKLVMGSCDHGIDCSGYIKDGVFLESLSDHYLYKKYPSKSTLL
jgi:hypothetical protein